MVYSHKCTKKTIQQTALTTFFNGKSIKKTSCNTLVIYRLSQINQTLRIVRPFLARQLKYSV